ncbi:hypothetical protein LTR17_018081 [Elasticomyces elasticus]|nr:hypothetical protein LTR17_018081 [Elasticomyces elasticus]
MPIVLHNDGSVSQSLMDDVNHLVTEADGYVRLAPEDGGSVSESNEDEEGMNEQTKEKVNDLKEREAKDEEKDEKKKGEDAVEATPYQETLRAKGLMETPPSTPARRPRQTLPSSDHEVGPADERHGVECDPRPAGRMTECRAEIDEADDDAAGSEPTPAFEVAARKAGNEAYREDPAEHIPAAENVETIRAEEPKGLKRRRRTPLSRLFSTVSRFNKPSMMRTPAIPRLPYPPRNPTCRRRAFGRFDSCRSFPPTDSARSAPYDVADVFTVRDPNHRDGAYTGEAVGAEVKDMTVVHTHKVQESEEEDTGDTTPSMPAERKAGH